ncbi:polysaccharide lyase family 4 protein [Hypoxylon sp. FL1284]|nr:polysaccharide lyase family 4 protein [Hypoxylon sp. FL1284]
MSALQIDVCRRLERSEPRPRSFVPCIPVVMAFSKLLAALAWTVPVLGITVSESDDAYTVDTGSSYGFTAAISRSSCDFTSLNFYGTEYQYSGTGSHIGSGLGSASVTYTTSGDYVIFQCVADSDGLTHYMVFADGASSIYMGTYTKVEPEIGELRYIFRLTGLTDAYPNGNVSYTVGGTAIEGSDVFLVDGETRSKFYSSDRFIDQDVYCATTTDASIHACFIRPNSQATEKSSGGPFFRDISLNEGGDYHSVTYYMNSNHVQTEDYRQGFHGPYVFSFTRSGVPKARDYDVSFFDDLELTGYTGASGRGQVAGTASGVSTDIPAVVHWYNDDYQGWAYADSSSAFTSPALVAGSYTMALYQGEFLAATTTVAVKAGSTATADIAATASALTDSHTTVFQMGDYDGQPTGFLNADLQLRMHPSDSRMADWKPSAVASTDPSALPMAIFVDVNNGQQISFSLDSAVDSDATLRIATTLAYAGGRPQASVNDFSCEAPAAPTAVDSRGVTRGAYRGRGDVYDCKVPSGTLKSGDNTITLNVISGSSGDDFLSPNVVSILHPTMTVSRSHGPELTLSQILDAIELFY